MAGRSIDKGQKQSILTSVCAILPNLPSDFDE